MNTDIELSQQEIMRRAKAFCDDPSADNATWLTLGVHDHLDLTLKIKKPPRWWWRKDTATEVYW